MRIAIIGSRSLNVENLGDYLPSDVSEIVSGGAKGIDSQAAEYARQNGLTLTEFLPDYARYGRGAPLKRNEQMVDMADTVLVIWDGHSKGTQYTVKYAEKKHKPLTVIQA